MANVASYAGKVAGIARTYTAIQNGDVTGALMSGAAAANGAGLIDQNTMSNIQNIAKISNVVQTGDVSRGIQLGLQYANGSDWAQQNQAGINTVNSAFSLYGSIANGSDADRINAAANFGQQMGVLNNQTAGNIHYATNFVSAVKSGDVNGITNALAEKNVINRNTAKQIQSANTLATAVKTGNVNQIANTLLGSNLIDASTAAKVKTANGFVSAIKTGDVNQLTQSLYQNNFIDKTTANKITTANTLAKAVNDGDVNQIATTLSHNKIIDGQTADNVVRLSNYYSSANQHKNSIEQMIQTKNFDVNAANDAYQFMMTGTNGGAGINNRSGQSNAYTPSFATPSIMGGFSNSFAGDSPAYKQSLLTTGADVATDFIPGVSNVKDATIALTGVNPITGEKVGLGGRLLSGFFALPVVGNAGKYIVKGGALAYKGVKLASKGAEVTPGLAKATGRHVDDVKTTTRVEVKKAFSLRDSTRSTFLKGAAERVVLNEPLSVYRVHGGRAGKVGRFATKDLFNSRLDARNNLALLQEWGNSITKMTKVELPKGTTIWVGQAAPQVGKNGNTLAGGGSQVFIDGELKASWFKDTTWFRSDATKN